MNSRYFAAALAVITSWAAAQTPLPESIGPYLQNPAPDAMTICYVTRDTGAVAFVLGDGASVNATRTALTGTPWMVWKARAAGLQPGKTYAYRVQGSEASFTTPNPAADAARFIVVNDVHDRIPTLEGVMAQVKSADYDFAVLLGDCWTDPSPANGAEKVFRSLAGYVRILDAAHKPMLLVRGNHETRGAFAGRMANLFDLPGLDAAAAQDNQNWPFVFRAGPLGLLALDTGEDDDATTDEKSYKRPKFWQGYRDRELPWLRETIAAPAFKDAPWHIYASHIPLYNPAGWESASARSRWESTLAGAKIDLMIAGHDHSWKKVPGGVAIPRTVKKTDGTTEPAPITPPCDVLIGGGPGANEATVMKVAATPATLDAVMIDAGGRELARTSLKR